jgi:hypothetical protein
MNRKMAAILMIWGMWIGYAGADTIELTDGTLIEGDFVGSSNGIVMFNTGEGIEAYQESEVAGIYLGGDTTTPAVSKSSKPAAAPSSATVPSGTRLVLRTTDIIDSRQHKAGHRFRAQLESAIVIDGVTVAPRGTFVHGRITGASQGGRAVGSAELAIEFTDIMIDDQLFEIVTEGMQAKTDDEASKTFGRTARSALIGGLISGKSGAKTGAKVGAGASLLTSGKSINVPRGTILETRLRASVSIPL